MNKNKFIFFIIVFLNIALLIIAGWLYMRNPLEKIYNLGLIGLILGITAIISSIGSFFFQKYDIKRIMFPLFITLILIGVYFLL